MRKKGSDNNFNREILLKGVHRHSIVSYYDAILNKINDKELNLLTCG